MARPPVASTQKMARDNRLSIATTFKKISGLKNQYIQVKQTQKVDTLTSTILWANSADE